MAIGGCGSDDESTQAATAPRVFFGVVPGGPLSVEDLERMGEGRVGTLRLFFPWSELDPGPAPDDYDWSDLDPIVAEAAENGITVLPYLLATPGWVAELDRRACGDSCDTFAPSSAPALAAWSDFVGAAVERYGAEGQFWSDYPDLPEVPVPAWQVWNEQNSPSFYRPRPNVDGFARLLTAAEQAIHSRDPAAEVVLGGMFGSPLGGEPPAFTASGFLRRLYRIDGIEARFDGVGVHPYAAQFHRVAKQVELVQGEVERAGDDASLWITELGWASEEGSHPLERGPDGQAERLREAFEYFAERRIDWRIETVTWYSWRDYTAERICAWCATSGLFAEADLAPKPAWEAYTAFTGGE